MSKVCVIKKFDEILECLLQIKQIFGEEKEELEKPTDGLVLVKVRGISDKE